MSEERHFELPMSGGLPGWVAVIGMSIFPPIGIAMVALTTWRPKTKVIVSIVGTVLWILLAVLAIRNQHSGPA